MAPRVIGLDGEDTSGGFSSIALLVNDGAAPLYAVTSTSSMRNPPSRKLISSAKGSKNSPGPTTPAALKPFCRSMVGRATAAERSTRIANVAYFVLRELERDLTDGY
jgi:hypothetical protein